MLCVGRVKTQTGGSSHERSDLCSADSTLMQGVCQRTSSARQKGLLDEAAVIDRPLVATV